MCEKRVKMREKREKMCEFVNVLKKMCEKREKLEKKKCDFKLPQLKIYSITIDFI